MLWTRQQRQDDVLIEHAVRPAQTLDLLRVNRQERALRKPAGLRPHARVIYLARARNTASYSAMIFSWTASASAVSGVCGTT